MIKSFWLVVFFLVATTACGPANSDGGDDGPGGLTPDAAPGGGSADAGNTPGGTAPGGACSCSADCADEGSHEGVCIYGVCMTKASAACASGGSKTECPTGSQCWNLTNHQGSLCWPECASHTCAGTCASDGTCEPDADTDCDPSCGEACSCTATSCGAGKMCVNGECVPDAGMMSGGPGAGPGPTCTLPTRDCTTGCSTLSTMNPRTNTAWDDYPINGETAANQYRSYLRNDLRMLVGYATSKTFCKSAGWTIGGNGGALGLGDMSEANGAIPGTSVGSPGHPAGTHLNGYDIDLGYYQTGTADNKLRAICTHTSGGQDQYHCTADPVYLDVWRTALFLGAVFESSRTRVIGVDGKAGPKILAALSNLCTNGWLSGTACGNVALAYETTDMGQGWYRFHHHHAHISLKPASFTDYVLGCKSPLGCDSTTRDIVKRPAGIHRLVPEK